MRTGRLRWLILCPVLAGCGSVGSLPALDNSIAIF